MIILKSIKLTNFLSHKSTEIKFYENQRLLIDGKSGSGKTSIVEALIWCLYGKGRVDNRSLVKTGKKMASVMLKLVDKLNETGDTRHYNVERTITDKGKQSLIISESSGEEKYKPSPFVGIKEAQEWIEKNFLRSSYLLFINSVAYPQDNTDNFVKQTAGRRKDMLLEIANVDNYDYNYEMAKDQLVKREKEIAVLDHGVKGSENSIIQNKELAGSLFFYNTQKQLAEKEIKELKNDIKIGETIEYELLTLKKEKENKQEEVDRLIKNGEELFNKGVFLDTKRKNLENISKDIDEIESKLFELKFIEAEIQDRTNIEKVNADRLAMLNSIMADKPSDRDWDAEIAELERQKNENVPSTFCKELGKECDTLKTYFGGRIATMDYEINYKKVLASEYKQKIELYTSKLNSVPPYKGEVDNYKKLKDLEDKARQYHGYVQEKNMIDHKMEAINEINKEIEEIKIKEKENDININLTRTIIIEKEERMNHVEYNIKAIKDRKLEEKLTDKEKILYDLISNVVKAENAKDEIDASEKYIADNKGKLDILYEEAECLTLIKEAFSTRGIKTVLVDYLIPRLEDKINEILSQLSEFRIRLDTQKATVDGESTVEGLYINIFNELGEQFDYQSYSGGEKLKISVAISEALASLQKCGFRILDEIFTALDETSTDSFASVINNFAQTICITHLRQIKDMFENKITIAKVDGTSTIK